MSIYYFVDTRKNAKTDQLFGISNPDVAKTFANDYKAGNGPFKPVSVSGVEKHEGSTENDTTGQNDIDPGVYSGMTVAELQDELKAREIEFKTKATKTELVNLLLEDDGNGGE